MSFFMDDLLQQDEVTMFPRLTCGLKQTGWWERELKQRSFCWVIFVVFVVVVMCLMSIVLTNQT